MVMDLVLVLVRHRLTGVQTVGLLDLMIERLSRGERLTRGCAQQGGHHQRHGQPAAENCAQFRLH